MSCNHNLNVHTRDSQRCHTKEIEKWLVIWAILLQIVDKVLQDLGVKWVNITLDLVDLLPALSTRFLQSMFNVVEGLIDLLHWILRDFFRDAIPPPCVTAIQREWTILGLLKGHTLS